MVHFLDPATGERLRSVQVAATNFMIWSFSSDLRWFVAWSWDRIGLICDMSNPSQVHRIPDYYPVIGIAGFSPDNRLLAYGTTNHDVVIWDLAAKRAKATLKGHRWWPFSVAFSPDGKWLASGGQDGDVWLWSVDTAKPRFAAPLKANMGVVQQVAFSSDSRTLATLGRGPTMRWWSVATGREMLSFRSEYHSAAGVLDFSAPGNSTGRLLLFYEEPGRVRVMTLPSLAEIDAAESQQARTARPR